MGAGIGQHRCQEVAVRGLLAGPLAQGAATGGDVRGQRVAQALQLPEIEQARLSGQRWYPVLDLHPAPALREEAGELTLEGTYLAPQLRASRSLVDRVGERRETVSDEESLHRACGRV